MQNLKKLANGKQECLKTVCSDDGSCSAYKWWRIFLPPEGKVIAWAPLPVNINYKTERKNLMIKHCQTLDKLLDVLPKNQTIVTNAIKAWSKVNDSNYSNIYCGISGGVIPM